MRRLPEDEFAFLLAIVTVELGGVGTKVLD
jgi:hypothetical protein